MKKGKTKKLALDLEIKRLSRKILKGQYNGPWCKYFISSCNPGRG